MMEQGTIISAEVLPKVAKEFAKAARQGDALAEALKTVRVQQGKFFTQSQKAQNTIFKSGYGEGLASFYQTMIGIFKELEPALRSIGGLFKEIFKIMGATLTTLAAPIKAIGFLIDSMMELNDVSSTFSDTVMPKLISAGLLFLTPWGKVLLVIQGVIAAIEEVYALTNKGVVAQVERNLGTDIGFDFSNKGNTKNSNTKSEDGSRSVLGDIKQGYMQYNPIIAGTNFVWSSIADSLKNSGTAINFKVDQQPVIDHSGGIHIETAIERSIQNGQAQR